MKSGSITMKLLALVVGAFLITAIGIFMVADRQLIQIIDRSQNAMYSEKVDVIKGMLMRVDDRLQKTGLVDAYAEDFNASALRSLRDTYYKNGGQPIYPFLLDSDGRVILHPSLSENDESLIDRIYSRMAGAEHGDFVATYKGETKWYIFSRYEAWDWMVCYAVPLDLKYGDARTFRNTLVGIIAGISLLVLVVLSFVLTRFTKPIVRLTHVASQMAGGNLDQQISFVGNDEVGMLASSFCNMRDAIKQKITALNREIEERRQAQKMLQSNEENLRTTLDSIGDAVIATDTDGVIIRMNPVAEQLVGWTLEEAKGRPLGEVFHIIHALTGDPAENPVEKVLASGGVVGMANHTMLISRDSSRYQIADSGAPIRTESGETLGVVLVFRDVTGEYELQEQLRQSQKMDAIGQLAGGVAHDFNNMLGGIMGAAELLEGYLPPDEGAKRFHEMIMESAERASGLTQKLLAFARKQPPASTVIDVHNTLYDTVMLLKSTIDRRVKVSVDLAADSSQVVGDPSQLQSAFLNLGINAAQSMPEGGAIFIVSSVVELESTYCDRSPFDLMPGAYIEIEVRDTGGGISADVLPHIFEPFFTTKAQGKGTGLGLAAVFGTIQQHCGAILVYSEEGSGASFQVLLPLTNKNIAHSAVPGPQEITGVGRILVVDDESVMRATAQAILEDLGYDVELAENGAEALLLFEKDPSAIDLVILDMMMPVMNGRDCFAALKKVLPSVRVVLSSGFAREKDLEQMLNDGLCGFIRKPYRRAELSRAVAEAMIGVSP